MRLVCPNCGAQYDIADDAIPEGGRDVQCSSCAHTWFQTEKPAAVGRKRSELLLNAPLAEPPPRKPLDSAVSDILRQEAAHESAARAAEDGGPPPTQEQKRPPGVNIEETRRRIAEMTSAEAAKPAPSPAAVAAAATGAVVTTAPPAPAQNTNQRAVPTIEEINASLRARAEASDTSGLTEAEQYEVVQRRGFRRGFFFVLILLAIVMAPYFFQAQINENLPQFSQYMMPYVETIDQMRLWLNDQVQALSAMIGDLTSDNTAT
ncbi:zinc-ribbon domain-containing protein [Cognatiyoonia sp. IB215446]|uniref:zinc-ribbon domain-containing protein n=1 Tax=Cognatiyoonia sp. IB215446 TaxID=3097355 RepID=UPI002A152BAF|nr:zinc-ribbon domain-containing protein [Cognatiyoonia sp. IB215446]MDX8350026.1 zinc-ribbon domain-containing protein [Cognatiyoonia sp. IB215446]